MLRCTCVADGNTQTPVSCFWGICCCILLLTNAEASSECEEKEEEKTDALLLDLQEGEEAREKGFAAIKAHGVSHSASAVSAAPRRSPPRPGLSTLRASTASLRRLPVAFCVWRRFWTSHRRPPRRPLQASGLQIRSAKYSPASSSYSSAPGCCTGPSGY